MSETPLQAVAAVFDYPALPTQRRHGPRGYTSSASFKPWLRDEFSFRCLYCLCRERWEPNGSDAFSVEHLFPRSAFPLRSGDYDELVYACCICNSSRADAPLPFDPSRVPLHNHLQAESTGLVRGSTLEGETIIEIFRLNRPSLVGFRRRLLCVVALLAAHQDSLAQAALREMLGFPDDLPKLAERRPPGGNTRPQGIGQSFFEQRKRGELPEMY